LGVIEYWGNALKRYSSGDVWTGYVDRRASSRWIQLRMST